MSIVIEYEETSKHAALVTFFRVLLTFLSIAFSTALYFYNLKRRILSDYENKRILKQRLVVGINTEC